MKSHPKTVIRTQSNTASPFVQVLAWMAANSSKIVILIRGYGKKMFFNNPPISYGTLFDVAVTSVSYGTFWNEINTYPIYYDIYI